MSCPICEVVQTRKYHTLRTFVRYITPLSSVNARNDPASDQRRIPVPVGSILAPALLLVPLLTVDQQRAKVHQEEVSKDHSPAPALGGLHCLLLQVPGGRVDSLNNSVAGNARRQAV